jgi:hypothetical protein
VRGSAPAMGLNLILAGAAAGGHIA